jgi:hypothetical protein
MALVFVGPQPGTVSGTQNAVNKVFTVANAPNPANSFELWLNGQLQTLGTDYSLSGATITFITLAPLSTDKLLAAYQYQGTPLSPGAVTVADIIYAAFRICGVLGNAQRNFSTAGSDYQDAFAILNDMIDQWNTQRLTILAFTINDFPLVAYQQEYQIGSGAQFNVTRPSQIQRAGLVYISANPYQPIEVPMMILTVDDWKSLPQKNVQSIYPLQLYYDMSFSAGTGNIYVYPIPTCVNLLRLYLWAVLGQFATVNDSVSFAPGYLKAIKYLLAKELAIWFPERAKWDAQKEKEANDAMEWLKSLNVTMTDLQCDEALVNTPGGMWNWRTGNYQGRPF